MGKLDGKVALVTGASRGLGKAIAVYFAKEGASIVVSARKEYVAVSVVDEIKKIGGKAVFSKCDITDRGQIKATVKQTIDTYGKIDILVNNASAILHGIPLMETTFENMDTMWKTSVLNTLYHIQECVPYMKEKGGRIINFCSGTGINGDIGACCYGSSKEAVRGITKVAARELAEYGITVNVVSPGALTEMAAIFKEKHPDMYAMSVAKIPMNRLGDPESEIAPVIAFLASDDACFVTGQTYCIDGGGTFVR